MDFIASFLELVFHMVSLIFALSIYFLPSLVAWVRNHHQANAIAVLNLLLGWTILGWIAALVWACTATPGQQSQQTNKRDSHMLKQLLKTPRGAVLVVLSVLGCLIVFAVLPLRGSNGLTLDIVGGGVNRESIFREIRNTSSVPLDGLEMTFTYRNKSGDVVGIERGFAINRHIEPGATSVVQVFMQPFPPGGDKIDTSFRANGQEVKFTQK